MSYTCEILADSVSRSGYRLTTFQITFPRFVLAEFNTHRVFSRSSASSRAIPVEKRIEMIEDDPFVPEAFAANKRGMQAGEALDEAAQEQCRAAWLNACYYARCHAEKLAEIGVHKQWANRLLEPFAWHTVIVTATEWTNFFNLRISKDAQPEIRIIAEMMKAAYETSTPQLPGWHGWHLPLVGEEKYGDDIDLEPRMEFINYWVKISVARCARVSYLNHEGKRDPDADIALYDRLISAGHMSPTEHAARPMFEGELASGAWCGNFRGWVQHRKEIPGESVFHGETK